MNELEYYKKLSELQETEIKLYKEQLLLKDMLIVQLKDTIELYKQLRQLNQ